MLNQSQKLCCIILNFKREVFLCLCIIFIAIFSYPVYGANDSLSEADIQQVREFFNGMSESIVNYHIDYQFDDYPLNEEYYPGGDYKNTITYADDWEMIDQLLESLRLSRSEDSSLDVHNSMYMIVNRNYDILDKERNKQLGEETLSFDGIQHYMYTPRDKRGWVSNDEGRFQIPRNPLLVYENAVKILGNTKSYEILSCTKDKQENTEENNSNSLWIFELLDTNKESGYHVEKFLVDISNMQVLYHREYYGTPERLTIQNQILFQDFSIYDLGNTNVDLPKSIIKETERVRDKGEGNDPLIFAKKSVFTVKNISATKLTEQDSFKINFPAGTKVSNDELKFMYIVGSNGLTISDTESLYNVLDSDINIPTVVADDNVPGTNQNINSSDSNISTRKSKDSNTEKNNTNNISIVNAAIKIGIPLIILLGIFLFYNRLKAKERR